MTGKNEVKLYTNTIDDRMTTLRGQCRRCPIIGPYFVMRSIQVGPHYLAKWLYLRHLGAQIDQHIITKLISTIPTLLSLYF